MGNRSELAKNIGWLDIKCGGNVDKLDDIDPAFAVFILGDEGLWLVQPLGKFRLRQITVLARCREKCLKKLLAGRAQGFLHSEQVSIENEEPFR